MTTSFYAFQFTDGVNTTTTMDGKTVTAGELIVFPSRDLRDFWVADGCNYRNDSSPFRRAVTRRDLPHGWSAKMANREMFDPEVWSKVCDIVAGITHFDWWHDPCQQDGEGHWAYATDAVRADDFASRLAKCESSVELRKLQKEERQSIARNLGEVADLVGKAFIARTVADYEERISDARRIMRAYGDDSEISRIEKLMDFGCICGCCNSWEDMDCDK